MRLLSKDIFPWRVFCLDLVAILFVFGALAFAFWEQNKQALDARDEVLDIQESINEIHILSSKLKSAVLAHHRYIMFGDIKNKQEYKSFQSNRLNRESKTHHIILPQSVETDLTRLAELSADDPLQRARIQEIENRFQSIWQALDEVIDLVDSGKRQQGLDKLVIYLGDQVYPMRLAIRAALKHELNELSIKTSVRDKEANDRSFLVYSALIFFATLEGAFLFILLLQNGKVQRAEKLARARAEESEALNVKLGNANLELSALNKTIQESKETQIKAIIDHALDGQIMMDAEGTIIRYNLAAEKMFRYAPAEVIGKNIRLLLIEPYASECLEHFRQHKERGVCNGTDHRHESVGKRKDHSIFPLDLSMSMFDLGGQLHFSWFLRDITERKRTEAEILRYMKELEKSNQDLDDFAYIASHDLKEPLRGLFNHAQFLQEDYQDKLDADGQRRLGRLAYLSQRMEHLVNDLLYFSRLGRSELAIQETDLNAAIFEIKHMLESMFKDNNVKLLLPSPLPVTVCDKPRMTEAFRNLIVNAVKYNDKPEKEVEIGFLLSSHAPHGIEKNVFYVRDNGMGIDAQYYQEIFRIFKRLHKGDASDQSTGSGLTFVKKIIERHKGHIWVESKLGLGTTFFFNLGTNTENEDKHNAGNPQQDTIHLAG